MCSRATLIISLWCLFPPAIDAAHSAERSGESAPALKDFYRSTLHQRFDKNGDGRLDGQERRSLRSAYGNIDVPMLPDSLYRYSRMDLPSYVDDLEFRRMDNTSDDNPLTDAGARLGRVLFYDTQLSASNTVACASCHDQRSSFADPRRYSIGFQGGRTGRNAMALVNLRYSNIRGSRPGFFWDERAATLEQQVLMPIQDEVEMGMQLNELEAKLQKLPYYPPLFQAAFGSPKVTSDRIAKAVAQFLRSLNSFDSRFDRAAKAADGNLTQDFDTFNEEENQGKLLFFNGVGGVAEFGCSHCHMPPTFGMPKSFNNGLELEYADAGLGARDVPSNDPFTPSNDGKFKAPSLRNVALTAPYMHDGRFQSLAEVMNHYSSGVKPHPNLGLLLSDDDSERSVESSDKGKGLGFHLTESQQSALVAFLHTLTDKEFVSNPAYSDPFVRLPDPPEQ